MTRPNDDPARELRILMADYLDELLDGAEVRAAEEAIAQHPHVFAEVARTRAMLYRPYAVPPPAEDQAHRILARFRDRPWRRVLRYAAVFVAGVASAALARPSSATASPAASPGGTGQSVPGPRVIEAEQPEQPAERYVVNRRLR